MPEYNPPSGKGFYEQEEITSPEKSILFRNMAFYCQEVAGVALLF
jgi:hypothetical protein